MNFPACIYKCQNFAKSQQNFALSHDGETVIFRNCDDMCHMTCDMWHVTHDTWHMTGDDCYVKISGS